MVQETNTPTPDKLTHSIFTFEWEHVLRVIGVITGITGIVAALIYVFGYVQVFQRLTSLGIQNDYFSVSLHHEFYLINGVLPFIIFATNVAWIPILYLFFRGLMQTVGRDILKRIRHPLVSLSTGVALGGILISIGISNILHIDNTAGIQDAFIFTFVGLDLLLITFELIFVKGGERQTATQYYNLIISALSTIKTIAFVIAILGIFFFSTEDHPAINLSGCRYLTESPISATIHSIYPLGLDGETNGSNFYRYNGYYLLYTDDKNYYFFKDLDADTLKPKSIIIVKKDSIETMQLEVNSQSPNWNLAKSCSDLYGN